MLKSKEIGDFVSTEVAELRPDEPIPADLHLFFKSSNHVLVWRPAGTVLTAENIENHLSKGIHSVWVHRTEWETFHQYLKPRPPEEVLPARKKWHSTELIYTPSRTPRQLLDITRDEAKADREKRALAAMTSRALLGELATPDTLSWQRSVNKGMAAFVRDFLKETPAGSHPLFSALWKISALDPAFTHAANVSSLSVLFALSFGNIDEGVISNVGLAALLHDVGISRIPLALAAVPWTNLSPSELKLYDQHTANSVELISAFSPDLKNAERFIQDHHLPQPASSGPASLNFPALIALADSIDSLCNGSFDGQERTLYQAMDALESTDRGFEKDLMSAVFRWIRNGIPSAPPAAQAA